MDKKKSKQFNNSRCSIGRLYVYRIGHWDVIPYNRHWHYNRFGSWFCCYGNNLGYYRKKRSTQ